MKHEGRMRKEVEGLMSWFYNCDIAYAEIARESGLHIASIRTDGKWNPSGQTLIKLARARDVLEKRQKKIERLRARRAQAAKAC